MAETTERGIKRNIEKVQGQGEEVSVREIHYASDAVVLDPNSDLAVQTPEGVGADNSGHTNPFADALDSGHVEAKFGTEAAPVPSGSEAGDVKDEATRSVGQVKGKKHTPEHG